MAKYIPLIGNIHTNVMLIIASTLLISALAITVIHLKHKYIQLIGLLFGILITITGILITSQNLIEKQGINTNIKSRSYLANIISNPVENKQSVKAVLSVTPISADSSHHKNPEKVLCYFAKDSLSSKLVFGDVISFRSKLAIPKAPLNPGEFDYGNYLMQSNINYTTYIAANKWKLIDYHPYNNIIAIAGKIRQNILTLLSENGLSGDNYAVAAAVLLGYDDFMENDLKQDYIMAGAMHILCVSGLHVGIIYLVINFLLSFLHNNRFNNILKGILLLLSVWTYATITGLSPSVQRASLMITIFIVGNMINRNRDTYNTLAISALILLLINPQLIFNVGFQLSYVAVLGIITFHQPIYKLIFINNTVVDKIWSITVLSFSAQLATFPLAIYYFNFFPPWFWLTNLFTFPLSFLIIATGLLFVLTSWIPFIPQFVGWTLSGMIYLLNYVVGYVKFLPFSGIDNIYTSMPMLVLIYTLILTTYIIFKNKNPKLFMPLVLTIVLILGLNTYNKSRILNQKKLVIYSINKHSAYDFINGNQHVLLIDSTLTSSSLNYQLKNSRTKWGIDDANHVIPTSDTIINNMVRLSDNFILFEDMIILLTDGNEIYYPTKSKLELDLVIISGKKKPNVKQLLSVFDFKKVVIDSSVPRWNQKSIAAMFKAKGISCHNVNKEGALVIEL